MLYREQSRLVVRRLMVGTSFMATVSHSCILTSGLGPPIKYLLDLEQEELKAAFSDWSHVQEFGICFSAHFLGLTMDRLHPLAQLVCHALTSCLISPREMQIPIILCEALRVW